VGDAIASESIDLILTDDQRGMMAAMWKDKHPAPRGKAAQIMATLQDVLQILRIVEHLSLPKTTIYRWVFHNSTPTVFHNNTALAKNGESILALRFANISCFIVKCCGVLWCIFWG